MRRARGMGSALSPMSLSAVSRRAPRQSRPKLTDVFRRSQSSPDRLHITRREKRAPVACQRDRAQISTAQPCSNRLWRDAEDGSDLNLGVDEWRSHAPIIAPPSSEASETNAAFRASLRVPVWAMLDRWKIWPAG